MAEYFEVLEVSSEELATIIAESRLAPIQYPVNESLRYVLLERRGRRIAALKDR
jgi:hypothetical protein